MHVGLAGPQHLATPIGRRLSRRPRGGLGVGITHRERDPARRVAHRIQHRQVVGAQLERAVDRAVGVERGVAAIGRDLVVQVRLRIGPVPFGDDHVALDALGARRRGRDGTGGDPIGPVGEHRQRALGAELAQGADHRASGLTRLEPPQPRRAGRLERPQSLGDLPRPPAAQLMTRPAAARLENPDPLGLTPHVGRRAAVPVGPRWPELVLCRHADQGKPVAGRVIVRGRPRVGRHDRGEIERPAGGGAQRRRVHQPVPPHPHAIAGLGEVGQQVAPLVVRDDDLDELGSELARLRDYPHARFGSVRAGDHSADVVAVDMEG